ncbi:MAG: thymidine phosphorylase [Gemmataceae bacterium]|nr:thymidine phosphorylase [Gemmataceae bacterium]
MRPVDLIRKKRDGHALTPDEIRAFIQGVTVRTWPDYQTSALLMAIVLRGMSADETAVLTDAMVHSGQKLAWPDLPGPKVDKHSTGGVGDKTSLIVAPLAAACGCIVPMMSGRGLGHTGGTLDKLEAIPGFRVGVSLDEFRTALQTVGCAMVGQTAEIAPADKVLYALRDVTATVESIPLITASILAKKIAEGIDALVMDVKCGQGAFMKTRTDARALAQSIVATGSSNSVRTEAIITAMDVPLGRMVGNALEVREAIDTLRGNGPRDLELLAVTLTVRMLVLGGLADLLNAEAIVRSALTSGRGLDVLRRMIAQQGGDPRVVDDLALLPTAPQRTIVYAERSGYVAELYAEKIGIATMLLGAGRLRVEDAIDHAAGVRLLARPGEFVKFGDALAEVHYRTDDRLGNAVTLLQSAWRIDDEQPTSTPLILEHVP